MAPVWRSLIIVLESANGDTQYGTVVKSVPEVE